MTDMKTSPMSEVTKKVLELQSQLGDSELDKTVSQILFEMYQWGREQTIESIKSFVNNYNSHWVCTSQQLPVEYGKAAGNQQACKEILKFLKSLENDKNCLI